MKINQCFAKWQGLFAKAKFFLVSLLSGVALIVNHPASANGQSITFTWAKPEWKVGNYWIVKDVEKNRLAPRAHWMPPHFSMYKVVDQVTINQVDCFIVEKWPYPISAAFPQSHAVYYFRVKDLVVVGEFEFFYMQRKLYAPTKASLSVVKEVAAGVPHIGPCGLWVPSFFTNNEKSRAAGAGRFVDSEYQIIDQQSERISLLDITSKVYPGESKEMSAIKVETNEAIQITLRTGKDLDQPSALVAFSRQIWVNGLPWFLYEEVGSGAEVFRHIWLVEHGDSYKKTGDAGSFDKL